MMHSYNKKSKQILIINTAAISFVFIITSAYFWAFLKYGANTPRLDDYLDSLYYLLRFSHSGWHEKLSSLFWQYNQHLGVLNKVIHLLEFGIFGRVDFFWDAFYGSLQLILCSWMTWLLVQSSPKSSLALLPIPFIYFLNLALWSPSYWAGAAIATLFTVTAPLVICLLLEKNGKMSFLLSLFIVYLFTFSYADGIIMAFLGSIQIILTSRSQKQKKVWLLMMAVLLAIYLKVFAFDVYANGGFVNDKSAGDKINIILHSAYIAPVAFFMLIGSAPFSEDSPEWAGVLTGLIIFYLILNMMALLWKNDRKKFRPILICMLYCAITFVLISIIRAPTSTLKSSYYSHYKVYTIFIFSVITIFYTQEIKNKFLKCSFLITMLFVAFFSFIGFFQTMVDSNHERRLEVTEWSIKGKRNTLGENGIWFYYSEQLLFAAEREGIYSPFDTRRGALYQSKEMVKSEHCPTVENNKGIEAEITNNKGAIGVEISVKNKSEAFNEIWLCSSNENYRLTAEQPFSTNMVIEKNKITAGEYSVLFSSENNTVKQATSTLTLYGEKPGMRCEATWTPNFKAFMEVRSMLCKKVFK